MDLYEKKFAEMQKYIPFLEAMIERLKKVKDKSREPQLQKMQSLHGILSKSNGKKLTIEKLDRCEELLLKLHNRVDKGNTSVSNIQSSRSSEDTKPSITGIVKTELASNADTEKDAEMYQRKSAKEETPASPSPPASPDQTYQPKIHVKPIIIPTERSDGYTGSTLDDRPASPDECEMVASVGLRQPVIIPTEPLDVKPSFNPLRKTDANASGRLSKWNFSIDPKQPSMPQKSHPWQSDPQPAPIATVGGSATTSKAAAESRPRYLRHIPTVPAPSKGASLIRKAVLVLDKKGSSQASGSETDSPTSKWDSPVATSSDADSHGQRAPQTSPKSKELPPLPKLPATRLLVSPPPVLTMPPLTTEELAELLNDAADNKSGRKPDAGRDNSKKAAAPDEEARKDSVDPRLGAATSKDGKSAKGYGVTHEDIESDRRWEEEYKHIVKMPSRRIFPSPSGSKHSEIPKFPPAPQSAPQIDRPTDPRKRPPSPIAKDRDPPPQDPRYADNYEKHSRPSRDMHGHGAIPEHSAFPRISDNDPNNPLQNDDRNPSHYQRRPYGPSGMHDQSSDPRREKSEYYNRMMLQQEREMQQQNVGNRPPMHHSPGRSSEPCNQAQWGPNANYPPGPQGPNLQYQQQQQQQQQSQQQQQQRPDMWTMKAGAMNVPMEPHMMPDPNYMRQGQYPPVPNNCRGPMMSPQDMSHGPCMDPNFRDDIPNQSMIPPHMPQMVQPQHAPGMPPMMQPQGYQMAPQYRGFPPENRPNVQQFDRPPDFPHPRQSWEQGPVNRPPENIQYPRQTGPGQWNRANRGGPPNAGPGPSVPPPGATGPVNRDRPYGDRGRGPEPSRSSGFSRDPRTRNDSPAQQAQQQHSPSGQTAGRREHAPPNNQNANPSSAPSNVRRDPRFAKDTAQPPAAKPKEHSQSSDRNARRGLDKKNKLPPSKDTRKSTEKPRAPHNKNEKKVRKETENDNKIAEKSSKDVMQSPLESLYGVIDTAAKTGKGYGLQKFKIPKIKRPEPAPSPPRIVDDTPDEDWEDVADDSPRFNDDVTSDRPPDAQRPETPPTSKEPDDKKAEVTSTTGESDDSRVSKEPAAATNEDTAQKEISVQSSAELEVVDTSTKNAEANPPKGKESENATAEASGDWQNFLEANILEKITELLHSKKLKEQFKKMIGSDSSSGSEKDNDEAESRKATSKRKKRVTARRRLSSDTSEEETLAERLGLLDALKKDKSRTSESRVDETAHEETTEAASKGNSDETSNQEPSANNAAEISNDTSRETAEAPSKKGKPFRRKKRELKAKPGAPSEEPGEEAPTVAEAKETNEDKPAASKEQPTKMKTKRRNSLEMLQEDVREMFISDEVVTATGFRSCRLQKEDQQQLNSSAESLFVNSKKKGSTSSLDRLGAKIDSDADEPSVELQRTSARGRSARVAGARKTKGKAKQRQSAKEIISSDSETEDSRADLSTTNANDNRTGSSKTSEDSLRSDNVEESSRSKDDSEETQFLRRSERVGLRESMREPRVHVRKSDAGKIDSSKIIFDSSSDESFGIDVSELTAAVDISLHPEPQGSSSPVGKATAKSAASKKRRSGRGRAGASKTPDERVESVASGDEVESIASDMSRTSSVTRGKKTTAGAGKADTNEELLSDILTGLVDPKTPGEGEDADARANTRRKKKKKPSWQMGILRKKKKKIQSPVPTFATETDADEQQVTKETKLESSFDIPESKVDPDDFADTSKLGETQVEPKEEILSDSSPSKQPENSSVTETPAAFVVQKEEPCSPSKSIIAPPPDEPNPEIELEDKKPLDELPEDTKSDIELTDSGPNLGVRKLMSYVWSTRKERFKCMLCPWIGKNIVHHYTLGHPGKEMMISRLSIPESKRAIGQAMLENYDKRIPKTVVKENRKFTCRFCAYTTEGSSSTALEAFYEHCTTHTGEYRFRCNCCPYQTVARSSMKTHYYRKACRNKYHGNMSLAICEDPVPEDDFIYGYICTKCNFVQLKESNVEKHVKNTHEKVPHVDVVRIDMSSFVDKNLYGAENSEEKIAEVEEMDAEKDPLAEREAPANSKLADEPDALDIVDEAMKDEAESSKSLEHSEAEPTSSQEGANDSPPVAGNLSVFVCPPELENKEEEIQHERLKKMQEVVENIGISNKTNEKRDLSIIDKLKDKMTTNIDESLEAAEAKQANSEAEAAGALSLPVLLLESVTSLASADSAPKESSVESHEAENARELPDVPVKDEPPDTSEPASQPTRDEPESNVEDKSEKKPKDPLANLEEPTKEESSDGEDSDRDTANEQPRSYESDSSEQSDAEIPADVNSLLEETFSINATANAPMMTTIQRLAAKLQGEKSLPLAGSDVETPELNEQESSESPVVPKPPNAIPISSIQRFLGRRNAVLQEVAKEIGETIEEPAPQPKPAASPPKKFIRLRRLSGDKLSVPGPSPEPSVEAPAELAPIASATETAAPESPKDPLEPLAVSPKEDEPECSFLKIENVISLAPGVENNPNEIMINDIRKAVASTPKTAIAVSLLKKPSPNILKRAGSVIVRPATLSAVPSLPTSPQLANQAVKVVKVIKGRTLLKQKDSTHRIFGAQLKNPENFAEMIKPENLRQFYKCMARTCSFSTDNLQTFEAHYRQHKETVGRNQTLLLTSYDFQRCAYCTETLTTWNAMSEHLTEKHLYCPYQCGHCFYRALAQSYVELHHKSVHQGTEIAVLLGTPENPPVEVIDRREFVIPFVCHHECGKSFYVPGAFLAHLRTKHGNSLSIFKCHLCPAPLFKAEQLVAHYKLHGIYKYQCLYCVFGSEQSYDVHAHLSASHYNRPPHILERTLQPRPVRDKDVIQQLVVLNVDEGYKCTELTLVTGQNPADIPKSKHWLQVDRNTSDGSAVGVVTLPIGNIGMNRLFPYEKLDADVGKSPEANSSPCNPATPIITKFRKLLPKKSPESLMLVEDAGTLMKLTKKTSEPVVVVEPTVKDTSSEALAAKNDDLLPIIVKTVGNAVSPTQNLLCNEEFVNFNILDNPGFIKAAESAAGSASSTPKTAAAESAKDKYKSDDSDIEIVLDIKVSPSKSTGSATKADPPVTQNEPKETSKEEKAPETVRADAEPVIVCSSAENSLDLNLNASTAVDETEESFERPLTLDDIKNTGFTGRNLYRCGYDSCEFGAETAVLLRTHIKECIFATETKNLNCVHCSKRFVKIGFLLEHFKLHGLKRFGCSMCKDRWTQPYQAMAHMKMKHRQTYSKLIPADPKNPSADGLFVVEPIVSGGSNGERSRGKKRGRAKSAECEKTVEIQKISYGPTEIEALPRQPIYQQEVHCAVCPYRNKVRTNIIRHLQLHAKDESVPESGPVNPVPCLDKNERMFDKMVNLASSSHQNGRMGGTKPKESNNDNAAEFLPKFIPENKRYVCGVTECNYLSIDEGMLRTHLKALHPEEPYFRCPHCPAQVPGHEAQNIAIDKMGVHLKMHDTRLYKCSHCNHHHYHRHVVERHLSDKHPEANPFVKVIREIENTESTQQQTTQETEESSADPDGNHWKCNVCDYKCIYKAEMQTHAASTHEEKSQFKCTLCTYKTNNKITFDQHVNAKHATDPSADYTMVYQKIKGAGPRRPAEAVEASGLDEPFDTTPLWRRDMPRIRHIRGILFEDEDPSQPESPAKPGKRKSDVEITTRPSKTKPSKATNDSSSTDKDDSWNGTLLSDTSMTADDFLVDVESLGPTSLQVDTSRLVRKFGPYGSPITHFWRCTICQSFKTKYKHDMRDHLYRDLKYFRHRCILCGYSGVSKNCALKHFMRSHENRRPTAEEVEALPVDEDVETWVKTLLKSQTAQMRGMLVDAHGNIVGEAKPKKTNVVIARRATTETPPKPNIPTITQVPLRDSNVLAHTVDLTHAINEMKSRAMTGDAEGSLQELEDEDSNDNDALVIDSKDDGLERDVPEDAAIVDDFDPIVDAERLMICKHCNMKFERVRGFKLHVQIRHLRRLNFLCPYCDTSSNSEKLMRKHLRLKHGNLPEQVNQNPAKSLPDLTHEFWEKEYGLPMPEKPKKRKRPPEDVVQEPLDKNAAKPVHVCRICGFRAINIFGLGVHARVHSVAKNYKCSYCTFASAEKSELWQHSEKNHANLDWREGNSDAVLAESVEIVKSDSSIADRAVEDYAEYVAAEASAAAGDSKSEDVSFVCFYCSTTRRTIESLKEHWKTVHKNSPKSTENAAGLPFRYKELSASLEKKMLRCGYCPKRGLAATIRLHSKKKHPTKPVKLVEIPTPPETWVCQWCGESVDSEAKKKVHQNMFHSHLPPSFERPPGSSSGNSGAAPELEAPSCPKCSFKTTSVVAMQKHVAKHVDSVRCKRCDKTFPDVTVAIFHNTQAHPGEVSAIEGFTANVEKMMARVNWKTGEGPNRAAAETVPRSALENWRNCGVAKKSTTKSAVANRSKSTDVRTVAAPIQPKPTDVRSVARKSTNPLPRYPPGTRFCIDEPASRPVSYYGRPRDPVNLSNISTYMTLGGGRQMKLNCTTLAQLIDIEPQVLVQDLREDCEHSALFALEKS